MLGDDALEVLRRIVHEISAAMAALDVDIVELATETSSAPMAGEALFTAHAMLLPPPDLDPSVVRNALEDLANELMVDIDVSQPAAVSDTAAGSAAGSAAG